jgi:hypothetical protein
MISRSGTKNKDFDSPRIRKALSVVSFIGIAGCIAAFIPTVRSFIIAFGETLVHRQLNHEIWNYQLIFMACAGLLVSMSLLCILSRKFQALSIPAER